MKKQSTCLYCNVEFTYDDKSKTGKFCSSACAGKHKRYILTWPLIEQGLVDQAPTLKAYLTETRGYACECCNTSEWLGKQLSLHLDHIDGNSDNNLPFNIRLLCPNCHSQTETFAGRNVKNTKRSSYARRYRQRKLVRDEGFEPPASGM